MFILLSLIGALAVIRVIHISLVLYIGLIVLIQISKFYYFFKIWNILSVDMTL